MGLFDNLLAPFGTGAQEKASADQQAAIRAGQAQGTADIGQGYGDIKSTYAQGLQPLNQTYGMAQQGAQGYGNATGVNGPAGNAAALKNFQAGPGYQFMMDQGLQNVERQSAAQGFGTGPGGLSGNTLKGLTDYSTGLANNTWQQYIQNLQPYLGQQSGAAGQIGALSGQEAGQLNANRMQQAGLDYGSSVGIGNAQAGADLAPLSAGANMWGLAGGLAKLGAGAAGGGGGGLFGNIFK